MAAQPSTAQPSTAQPSTAQPSTAQPSTAQPSTAQPSTAQPSTAQPSTVAEQALQKVKDQVTCGICLQPYTRPKLLNCFHVFCEGCLQDLASMGLRGQGMRCPSCREEIELPRGGVPGLQGAFYIHHLFDIRDALQKVCSSDGTRCDKCKKRNAARFCRTCGFVCQRCVETHQEWEDLASHEIIDLDTLTGDVTTLVPPMKKQLFCSKHPTKNADLYCDTCDELICRDCIVRVHHNHSYDLVLESFPRHKEVIVASLRPVKQQLATLSQALESLVIECTAVLEQKHAVVAEISDAIARLQQALEVRKTELVGLVDQAAQQKLKGLAAQKDQLELKEAQLQSCRRFVQESLRTGSQGEILRMKRSLVRQIKELTRTRLLEPVEQVELKFRHREFEVIRMCRQVGTVSCFPVFPGRSRASSVCTMEGDVTSSLSVEMVDRERETNDTPVDGLSSVLVASDGRNRITGTVRNGVLNSYRITYHQRLRKGRDNRAVLSSPFTAILLPNLSVPTNIIEDLNKPWGIAVREGGGVVVAESAAHCVSIISTSGEKTSFGTRGSDPGQMNWPEGVAIDSRGDILVCDRNNHRIQQFSPTGEHLQSVGSRGKESLQFKHPEGIAVHPVTHQVIVADTENHRIQVLNSDLTHATVVGEYGCSIEQFKYPFDVATDSSGNVYVSDSDNHRIQVFSADFQYVRQFGKQGREKGELNKPTYLAIDSHNLLYVTESDNKRVSIFSATDGEFITSFGSEGAGLAQFDWLHGIAVASDMSGTVYVCDTENDRIQIF